MSYKLVVSKEAHGDINEIVTYIAQELKNTKAAAGFLDDVENSYRHIVDNPYIYALCEDAHLHDKGYRKAVIKNYLVLYRVDEPSKTAYITRVVYGARDYSKLL